ncbi:MAG TPA: RecX family transcriptional regulator [Blastocatellia bacterium]|nr:RecX family transcriptional regulator [Blastocatellia bacterium]
MEDKLYERVMKRAFNLLSAKPRSIAELRERLLEKPWAEAEAVDRAIARLQELGYLNDQQYAEQFANSRLTVKPIGKTRLRRDLQRKKLSQTIINQAVENVYDTHDEEALIDQAIAKRTRLRGKPTTREEAKKLLDHLLRQGFSYDLAMRKVRAAGQVDDDDDS